MGASISRVLALSGAALACVSAFPQGAGAEPGWQTAARAERNILDAPRALARRSAGLVDRRTNLVRQNVAVACVGTGPHRGAAYARFDCTVRYRSIAIALLYLAQPRNGFELHDPRR